MPVTAVPQNTGRNNQIFDALTDARDQFFVREFLARKIALHQLLGQLGHIFRTAPRGAGRYGPSYRRNGDLDALAALHAVRFFG